MPNRPGLVCAAVAASVVVPSPAGAQSVLDRVQVGAPDIAATRGFAENLSIAFTAPAGFERGCCYDFDSGEWIGPVYRDSADPALQNASTIDWELRFVKSGRSLASLARSGGWADYPRLSSNRRRIRHVVAGRTVGTLPGHVALDAQAAPGARAQITLAIDLGRRVKGLATLTNGAPASDRSAGGSYTVNGVTASTWNRDQLRSAATSFYVEGSLPPAKVRITATRRAVSGRVSDQFGHPVAQTPVELQRRSGGGWKPVDRATSGSRGTYRLDARAGGRYRVVAKLAGTVATSARLRVR